jgi:predicted O-methyltransferase YrrM
MNVHEQLLAEYCELHSSPEPEWLTKCVRNTHLKQINPRMLSGHLQGRMLSMLSGLIKPVLALEVGTFTGYAAMCLAEGLAPGGKLITLEEDPELERSIRENIAASPFAARIEPVIQDAMEWLKQQHSLQFDLVFLDADKCRYPEYLEQIIPVLKPGGLLIADNTLWSSKVLDSKQLEHDRDTKAIHVFNKALAHHPEMDALVLPFRDGLSLARKKNETS